MINEQIKKLRLKSQLTQDELANKLCVSRSLIAKWEQNRSTPPKQYISKLCEIFGCQPCELIIDTEPPLKNNKLNKYNLSFIIISITLIVCILSATLLSLYIIEQRNNRKDFSKELRKEYHLEHLILPTNNFIASHDSNQIEYSSNNQEYIDFCNYVFMHLSLNSYVNNLYLLDHIEKRSKTCYLLISNSFESFFVEENLFNVYYTTNPNKCNLISISYNSTNQRMLVAISSNFILNNRADCLDFDYCYALVNGNE